jgi:hypothetical protein
MGGLPEPCPEPPMKSPAASGQQSQNSETG